MIKNDITVANYFNELGFRPARNSDEFKKMLVKAVGKKTAAEIQRWRKRRGKGRDEWCNSEFYPFKNSSYQISMALSGLYDTPLAKYICNFLLDNKKSLGKKILEVGCDNGVISCFLAKLCPDSQIVAIDKYEESITIAKKLAKNLQIENIEFKVLDVANLDDELFDTVISSRVAHEIQEGELGPSNARLFLKEQGQILAKTFRNYAEILSRHLHNDGTLFSCERITRCCGILGWTFALNDAEIGFDAIVRDKVFPRGEILLSFLGKKGVSTNDDDILAKMIRSLFPNKNSLTDGFSDEFNSVWDESEAVILQLACEDLVEGYNFYSEKGQFTHRFAIWNLKKNCPIYFGAPAAPDNPDNHIQQFVSLPENKINFCIRALSELKNDIQVLHDFIEQAKQKGAIVKKIVYKDGHEVELDDLI